jgi:Flp pilus assembly protein TadG
MPRRESTSRTFGSGLPRRISSPYMQQLKGEEGGSLVEYAISFILFATMLFGITGFGLGLYAYHFVGNAAREATRWASVNGSSCATDASCKSPATASDVQAYVGTIVPPGIDATQVTVATVWPSTGGFCTATKNHPTCTVKVQVSYKYNFILPLVHITPLTLSSTSETTITH